MAKPAGAACNLACHYCYYLEKAELSEPKACESKTCEPNACHAANSNSHNCCTRSRVHVMSTPLLEEFTRQYIQMQTTGHVLFTWHGGEPMLRPLEFYKEAQKLQRKYAEGRHIENCIQTNGTLLTPEWCQFLRDNNWLVGISIDGPEPLHDAYRRDRSGQPTHHRVMKAIRMLQHYGVEWNAMATVNSETAKAPLEFYRFFKSIGCQYLQFTPVVERTLTHDGKLSLASPDDQQAQLTTFSVSPQEWGNFCCTIFDEWVKHDVGRIFVQLFDATLANWLGITPGLCTMARECGHAGVIESNGDVYSCDHFVFPQHRLGNIHQDTLINLMYGKQQSRFAARKRLALPSQCKECRWLFACNGECPRNRFALSSDNQPGLNYLCQGYHHFFAHVAPQMDKMANLYRAGHAPADIMKLQS